MDSVTEPSHQDLTQSATGPEPVTAPWSGDVAPGLQSVLTGAVDAARAAIEEHSGEGTVGEYLGAEFEDPTSATHRFLAELPGYRGWQWAVVVAACPGAEHATISEVVLVPGPTALLAPKWVPWEERIRPGDLSPGDLLAPPPDDPRLVPGYMATGDPMVDEVATRLRRIEPAELEEVTADGRREELAGLLRGMNIDLRELSGVITATHLSLPGGMQPLWGPDARRVMP